MWAILAVPALTAILLALHWFARNAGPWAVAALYMVLPATLTWYWLRVNDYGFFPWIKIYTVLFCACYGSVLRYSSLGERRSARRAITVLLGLNILEAATLSVIEGGFANLLNAAAALVLIAALPWRGDAVQVAETERRDLLLNIPRLWIVGYTVWNFAFVVVNYPQFTGHHIAVLGAALLIGLIDPKKWVQARAYTLGVYFIAVLTFRSSLHDRLDTSDWIDPRAGLAAAVLALLLSIASLSTEIRLRPVIRTDP